MNGIRCDAPWEDLRGSVDFRSSPTRIPLYRNSEAVASCRTPKAFGTEIESRGKISNRNEWNAQNASLERDSPTWLGLSETENAVWSTKEWSSARRCKTAREDYGRSVARQWAPAFEAKAARNGQTYVISGPIGPMGPTKRTGKMRVSKETRPRGSVSPRPRMGTEGECLVPFQWFLERNGGCGTSQSVGMARLECESRRDSPTWHARPPDLVVSGNSLCRGSPWSRTGRSRRRCRLWRRGRRG